MKRKDPMDAARQFVSPWRERQPDGTLGPEYGPSPATLARHVAKWKNWAWRLPSKEARQDAGLLIAFMRGSDGELREDVPPREAECYLAVIEQGHSVRWAARKLRLSRSTVRVYLRRLRKRAEAER